MVDLRINRYARSAGALKELTSECMGRLSGQRSGLAILELAGSDEVSDLARAVERKILDRAFGDKVPHTPDLMTFEYGPYEDRSSFFLAIDLATEVSIGSLRVVSGLPNKTTADLSRTGLLKPGVLESIGCKSESTWDVATVAVAPNGGATTAWIATMALYRALYTRSLDLGISHWVSVIDDQVLLSYKNLGIPFRLLDGVPQLSYLGSDARAYVARVSEVRSSMSEQAATSPSRVERRIYAMLDGAAFLPEVETVTA